MHIAWNYDDYISKEVSLSHLANTGRTSTFFIFLFFYHYTKLNIFFIQIKTIR
jgi:hypothetical protein